jgi:hypothetical protein
MIGDTPARNPATAAAPKAGFTPRTRLDQCHARSGYRYVGHRNIFGVDVLRHLSMLQEVIDPVVRKETTENKTSEQKGGLGHDLFLLRTMCAEF